MLKCDSAMSDCGFSVCMHAIVLPLSLETARAQAVVRLASGESCSEGRELFHIVRCDRR